MGRREKRGARREGGSGGEGRGKREEEVGGRRENSGKGEPAPRVLRVPSCVKHFISAAHAAVAPNIQWLRKYLPSIL